MAVTMFGGADTSYAENFGAVLGLVTGSVFADFAETVALTDLRAADGTTVTTAVTTDARGHYKFGVNNHNTSVYVDFGLGPKIVLPADVAERLAALEAGGGGGGGGGTVDTAARAAANSALLGLATKADIDPGTFQLTLSEVPPRAASILQQPGVATVGRIGQCPVTYPTAGSYVVLTADRAPLGSGASVTAKSRAHGGTAYRTPITLALTEGQKRNFSTWADTVASGDNLFADVTAVGSSEPGGGFTIQFLGVGADTPPALIPAPAAPTALTVTATSGTVNTLAWTAPVSGVVSGYDVYATPSGGSFGWIAHLDAPATGFVHTFPTGTFSGYQVTACNDDASSAMVGVAVSGRILVPAANGVPGSPNWFASKGSTAGAASTVTSNRLVLGPTGTAGSNALTDRQMIRDLIDAAKLSGEVRGIFKFDSTSCYVMMMISCNDYDLSSGGSATSWVQMQLSCYAWQLRARTSTSVFSTIASGSWGTAITPGVDTGFRFLADAPDMSGNQALHCYSGAYAGSMVAFETDPNPVPLIGSGTVPSATRSLIPSGKMVIEQLGTQVGTTPVAQNSNWGVGVFIAGSV